MPRPTRTTRRTKRRARSEQERLSATSQSVDRRRVARSSTPSNLSSDSPANRNVRVVLENRSDCEGPVGEKFARSAKAIGNCVLTVR